MIKNINLVLLGVLFSASAFAKIQIMEIQNFKLKNSKIHYWEKEQPQIKSGSLLIIKTNGKKFGSTQAHDNIIMFGDRIVEKLNNGHNPKLTRDLQ